MANIQRYLHLYNVEAETETESLCKLQQIAVDYLSTLLPGVMVVKKFTVSDGDYELTFTAKNGLAMSVEYILRSFSLPRDYNTNQGPYPNDSIFTTCAAFTVEGQSVTSGTFPNEALVSSFSLVNQYGVNVYFFTGSTESQRTNPSYYGVRYFYRTDMYDIEVIEGSSIRPYVAVLNGPEQGVLFEPVCNNSVVFPDNKNVWPKYNYLTGTIRVLSWDYSGNYNAVLQDISADIDELDDAVYMVKAKLIDPDGHEHEGSFMLNAGSYYTYKNIRELKFLNRETGQFFYPDSYIDIDYAYGDYMAYFHIYRNSEEYNENQPEE